MNEYVFSYGTLQEGKVQIELFGRHLNGHTDILRGYKLSLIEFRDVGFVSHSEQTNYFIASASGDENDAIEGTVLELTQKELSLADKYEPDEYERKNVTLESGKQAWVYVKPDDTLPMSRAGTNL